MMFVGDGLPPFPSPTLFHKNGYDGIRMKVDQGAFHAYGCTIVVEFMAYVERFGLMDDPEWLSLSPADQSVLFFRYLDERGK